MTKELHFSYVNNLPNINLTEMLNKTNKKKLI